MAVVDAGERNALTVGLCQSSFPMTRQPGWEPHSYGYHASDGCKYNDSERGEPYGPGWGKDDVIGCGIENGMRSIFWTKNGEYLGVGFRNVATPLFPVVSVHSPFEKLTVNFGQKPFAYNIAAHIDSLYQHRQREIMSQHVSPDVMASIVRSYLLHNAHVKTLKALDAALGDAPIISSRGSLPGFDDVPNGTACHKHDHTNGGYHCTPCLRGAHGDHGVAMADVASTPLGSGEATAPSQYVDSPPMDPPPHVLPPPTFATARSSSSSTPINCGTGNPNELTNGVDGRGQWIVKGRPGGASESNQENGHGSSTTDGATGHLEASFDDLLAFQTIDARHRIRVAILQGDIADATQQVDALFPGLTLRQPHVLFILHCQAFIELVRSSRLLEALNYCQANLAPYRGRMEDVYPDKLNAVVALLAYSRPEASAHVAPLLQHAHREMVASAVNSAVLSESGAQPNSSLQRLLRQLVATHDAIREHNNGCGQRLAIEAPKSAI